MGNLWKVDNTGTIATGDPNVSLNKAFLKGKTIDGANSEANAVQIGDATNKLLVWADANGSIHYKDTKTGFETIEGGEITTTYISGDNKMYKNVKFTESVIVSNSTNVIFDSCTMDFGTSSEKKNFLLQSTCSNVTIRNCLFNFTYTGELSFVSIFSTSAPNTKVTGNTFKLYANNVSGSSAIHNILLYGEETIFSNNNVFVMGTQNNTGVYGLYMLTNNLLISGNVFNINKGTATGGFGRIECPSGKAMFIGNIVNIFGAGSGVAREVNLLPPYCMIVGNSLRGLNISVSAPGTGSIMANNVIDTSAI